jgi:hypothetical protein
MDLSTPQRSVQQSNGSIPFQFPPMPTAVPLSYGLQPPDAPSDRDDLGIGDIADDFEHGFSSLKLPTCCSASVKGTEACVNEVDDTSVAK